MFRDLASGKIGVRGGAGSERKQLSQVLSLSEYCTSFKGCAAFLEEDKLFRMDLCGESMFILVTVRAV